jgi:hypothetical protein
MTSPAAGPRSAFYARTVSTALLVLYAAWYAWLALGLSLPAIVNGLLDDSFYYLEVARNVAAGLGSTFDGVEPTNGYHPLWLGLLVPVFALFGSSDEAPVRAALVLAGVLGVGSLLWIRSILGRVAGEAVAIAGLLLFAWPRFFGQTVGLLETGLLLFLYLAIVAARLGYGALGRPLVTGVLLGLACLARLDSVFLVAAYGVYALRDALEEAPPAGRASARARALLPLVVAIVVVAPYLLWNVATFGHLQPISGAMKSSFPRAEPTWAYLTAFPEFTLLLVVGAGFAIAGLRAGASPFVRAIGIFGAAALLQMSYLVLFMRWGVDRWYFTLLFPVGLLGLPWIARAWIARIAARPALAAAALVAGVALAVFLQLTSLRLRDGRYLAGTRELAIWARENLPAASVVAATDSGVFGYFSGLRTINLDGLINNYRYREELRAGRLAEYLGARGVTHVLDQYNARHASWLDGTYVSRPLKIWFRPENRVAGTIELYRADEAKRIDLLARMAPGAPAEPNALILWRYRPPAP